MILVLNEVEFFFDSLARFCDSKFKWPSTPALKKKQHYFQHAWYVFCLIGDFLKFIMFKKERLAKLNCSTPQAQRSFEGHLINVLILVNG